MKKTTSLMFLFLILFTFVFVAFTAPHAEPETKELKVEFVKLGQDYKGRSTAIYVSHEKEMFFEITLDSYEKEYLAKEIESLNTILEREYISMKYTHKYIAFFNDKEKNVSVYSDDES